MGGDDADTRRGAGASAWSGEGFAEPTPRLYDAIMWPAERLFLRRWRRRLYGSIAAGAGAGRGAGGVAGDPGGAGARVLEIGAGTGAGFGFYPAGSSVMAVEPSVAMAARARQRAAMAVHAARGPAAIEVVEAWAEQLPVRRRLVRVGDRHPDLVQRRRPSRGLCRPATRAAPAGPPPAARTRARALAACPPAAQPGGAALAPRRPGLPARPGHRRIAARGGLCRRASPRPSAGLGRRARGARRASRRRPLRGRRRPSREPWP